MGALDGCSVGGDTCFSVVPLKPSVLMSPLFSGSNGTLLYESVHEVCPVSAVNGAPKAGERLIGSINSWGLYSSVTGGVDMGGRAVCIRPLDRGGSIGLGGSGGGRGVGGSGGSGDDGEGVGGVGDVAGVIASGPN